MVMSFGDIAGINYSDVRDQGHADQTSEGVSTNLFPIPSWRRIWVFGQFPLPCLWPA